MSKLEELRQSIDQIDQELVRLFERRMAVTREVGEYKQANGIPVLDTAREREVLAKKVNLISNPDLQADVVQLYENIMAISRRQQRSLVLEGQENVPAEDIAASFQYCVCDVLASRLCEAAKKAGADTVALAGGVAANKQLRELTKEYADKNGMKLVYPPLVLCTDNAAMIGARAYFATFENNFAKSDLNAVATKDIM